MSATGKSLETWIPLSNCLQCKLHLHSPSIAYVVICYVAAAGLPRLIKR